MKILVLIHEFPPVGGGGGNAARDLCEGLSARGHELTVITANVRAGSPEEPDGPNLPYKLIRVNTLRRDRARASIPAMISFMVGAFWRSLKVIRSWEPDLIHVHFAVPAGPIAYLLSRLTGLPYMITIHLGDIPGGNPTKTKRWFRAIKPFTHPIWENADGIIAVSDFSRQLALEHYSVPVKVIHNGVDLTRFHQDRIEIHHPPRIVFAGRFVHQKNPLLVVRTMASLKDLEWELLMIGDGELYKKVKEEVYLNGLEERTSLPGWLSPDAVREELQKSDILFMPSLAEGLPVVGVQALASGLGMVVSDIGGFADLVDHGKNGFLCPIEKPESYQKQISNLLNDHEQLYQSRLYSIKKSESFRLEKIVVAYEAEFKAILENG